MPETILVPRQTLYYASPVIPEPLVLYFQCWKKDIGSYSLFRSESLS